MHRYDLESKDEEVVINQIKLASRMVLIINRHIMTDASIGMTIMSEKSWKTSLEMAQKT